MSIYTKGSEVSTPCASPRGTDGALPSRDLDEETEARREHTSDGRRLNRGQVLGMWFNLRT